MGSLGSPGSARSGRIEPLGHERISCQHGRPDGEDRKSERDPKNLTLGNPEEHHQSSPNRDQQRGRVAKRVRHGNRATTAHRATPQVDP